MNDDDRAGEDDAEDRPLREDIRLLDRLLGDTLREQAGEQTFNLVEHVRQPAVRFRRTGDKHARAELEEISGSLTHDFTESVA